MKKLARITGVILAILMVMSMSVIAFAADGAVAKIGEAEFATLQAAINACTAGDNTIILIDDCAETVTIKQQADINIVIDGNGKTYSGTIKVDGNKRPNGAETLTIKNVNFENTSAKTYAYFIDATKNGKGGNSEAHNLTVDSCSFKSTNWHYAIATRHPYNLLVKNCVADSVYYFLYNPQGGSRITVEGCVVTKATYGIGSQKCLETYVKNYTYIGKAAGIYGRATSNEITLTMENVDITTTLAGQPAITLWKNDDKTTSKTFNFVFVGDNKITAPEGVTWFARHSETNSPYVIKAACNVDMSGNEFKIVHTPGAEATCLAAQTCTVCGAELDAIKVHEFAEYTSNNDATCQADGTKTAHCIYGCGLEDTIIEVNTKKEHTDADGNGNCDYCEGKFCNICGVLHEDLISECICLLIELVRLMISFIETVF